MCSMARCLISAKVRGRLRMIDSQNGLGHIPFLNAYTIIESSVVPTFTTCAPKRLMYSFKVSPRYCFTSNKSYDTGGGARFAMYCSRNNCESCVKEVMWPFGRLTNQSMAIPVNMLMKSLHLTASDTPTSIICVWNAVRSASESSIPVKVTLGPTNV